MRQFPILRNESSKFQLKLNLTREDCESASSKTMPTWAVFKVEFDQRTKDGDRSHCSRRNCDLANQAEQKKEWLTWLLMVPRAAGAAELSAMLRVRVEEEPRSVELSELGKRERKKSPISKNGQE